MIRTPRLISSTPAKVFGFAMAIGFAPSVFATTLCVNTGGTGGCYSTISAAVSAANPYDTIKVAAGTYTEAVVIGKALTLEGSGLTSTTIDATGLANGVYIDGLDNSNLADVTVTGFTIKNAKYEGVLITNSSYDTISNNRVTGNNRALDISTPACPGLPAFETSEAEDCGEGVHLVGSHHVTVSDNIVSSNSGGILLSDETGSTHNNLITNNSVTDNMYDCGITLASHPPYGADAPYGLSNNTISSNLSARNGLQVPGAGAGVGIFAPFPGTINVANVVVNNQLIGNGLPGVTMHNHAYSPDGPPVQFGNNVIIGNFISGNAADTEDAATPGTTGINIYSVAPIYGTIVAQNTIVNEAIDLAFNSSGFLEAHTNNFNGHQIGVDNLGTGGINVTWNYWGCANGPGAAGCTGVTGNNVNAYPPSPNPF